MSLRRLKRSRLVRVFFTSTILSLALATASSASAELFFDIRAADGSKFVSAHSVGQVVNFDIFVSITGEDANPNNDTFHAAYAYLRSVGPLLGDLSHVINQDWSINNDSDGLIGDRDGDGDLDVGAAPTASDPNGSRNNSPGQIHYRSGAHVPGPGPFRLGSGTFTVNNLADQTAITFYVAQPSGLIHHPNFVIDGITRNGTTDPDLISVGAPLIVAVPEPATLTLVALLPLTLLRRHPRI